MNAIRGEQGSSTRRRAPGPVRWKRRIWLVAGLVTLDMMAVAVALMAASWIWFGSVTAHVAFENTDLSVSFGELALFIVPVWAAFIALSGLYDLDSVAWGFSETGRIARALSFGVVALILGTYVVKLPGLSRAWTLLSWLISIILVLGARASVATALAYARRHGQWLQPTLVVGSNSEASDIIRVLRADPGSGFIPVGCLASSLAERLDLDYCSDDVPVIGNAREIRDAVEASGATAVIIASTAFDHDVLARMIAELRGTDVDIHVSSGLFEVLTSRVVVKEVAGVPLITVKGVRLSKTNLLVKRIFDLIVAGIVLLVGLPLWLLIALGIKLTSSGPVFYAQTRVGRDGETFAMLKFRSMYADADERLAELMSQNEATGPLFKMRDDPRVTRVGRFLRKFSVDEFPQLLNVFRGEMSLVGPRPPLPHETEKYSPNDWRRLEVVPGMTGLWQVSGRSSLTFEEMVRLDLFYIENWSVSLDITLLFRTLPAMLSTRGAY